MKGTMEHIRNRNADKSLLWFLRLTGVVLFALGVLKLIGLGQEIKFFTFPDPLLSFANNWQTSLGSALLEIGLALFLWFGWSEKWKLLTLTGTTLVFLSDENLIFCSA